MKKKRFKTKKVSSGKVKVDAHTRKWPKKRK